MPAYPTNLHFEHQVRGLIAEHWPLKLKEIPELVAKYRGKEAFLVSHLQKKAQQRSRRRLEASQSMGGLGDSAMGSTFGEITAGQGTR
jgi:hypothetical protein